MQLLGEDWTVNQDLFSKLNRFTCISYSAHTNCASVNELRYELFRLKKGKVHSAQLPPCEEDTLFQHAARSNYQAARWKRSHLPRPSIPQPVGHGWEVDNGIIHPKWMSGAPAPESILDFLSCECKVRKCRCLINNMKFTPMCKLQTCSNMTLVEEPYATSDSDDD